MRTHRSSSFLSLVFLTVVPACCSKDTGTASAAAKLSATADMLDEKGTKIGTAELRQTGSGVEIEMQISGLPPGPHALHIHNVGNCHTPGPDGKAFSEAGAHFNPYGKKHGVENPEGPHAGDLPNFTAGSDGTATVKVEAKLVTLEDGKPNSLFHPGGTCLVIHAKPDDNKTDPTGNSGDRIACGVIRRR